MGTVLVTGGGSGIGEGIVTVLADRGWRVAVNDLDEAKASSVAERVGGVAVPGDVSEDPAGIVATAARAFGGLDALVNNVGILRRVGLDTVDAETLDLLYHVNLRATVLASQAALGHFGERGAIVNISSIAALTPQMNVGLYSATKAGVSAFTAQAAVEWGPRGVRVNAVAPGMVRTAMAEVVYADPELYEQRRSMIPVRRIGTPADIGAAVAFLLDDEAAGYITGVTLPVDGGFTNTLIDLLPHPKASDDER